MLYKVKLCIKEILKEIQVISLIFRQKTNDDLYYMSKLAKCCHILDKGCYTVPFEKNHSIGIYEEAKTYIQKIKSDEIRNDSCYKWCLQRINNYEKLQTSELNSPKYIQTPLYKDSAQYDEFIKSFISVRRFNEKEISNDIIVETIKTAQTASSSCFRQTPRCYAIKSKSIINSLSKNIAGLTGFSNGVPLLFCITSDIRTYDCVDRNLAFIDSSLFAQNLVLSLRAKNIYSVFLNFLQASKQDVASVKTILKIPEYEKIIIFIACGYSDFISEKPVRLDFNKICNILE